MQHDVNRSHDLLDQSLGYKRNNNAIVLILCVHVYK
jgi:hypothetical protein